MKAIRYSRNGLEFTVEIRLTAEATAAERGVEAYEIVDIEEPELTEEQKRMQSLEEAVMANQDWILDKEVKEALKDLGV